MNMWDDEYEFEYKIISGCHLADFERDVVRYYNDGYALHGGVAVSSHSDGYPWYTQAMIRNSRVGPNGKRDNDTFDDPIIE